jgi:hypothetical protein
MHVGDEQRRAVHPNLPAARAVEVGQEGGIRLARHETPEKWDQIIAPEVAGACALPVAREFR